MVLKEALRFLVPVVSGIAACLLLSWMTAAAVLTVLGAGVALFFRNPKRSIPADEQTIVSPADGRVVRIERVDGRMRLSIFLSIFDVHVNRSPISGTVSAVEYVPGRFLAAFNHAASEENERNTIEVRRGDVVLRFTQIAGLVARRIVCWIRPGDQLSKGQLIGLIRFGSRVDVSFPDGTEITVSVGQRVQGGSTVIGRLARP